MDVNTDPSSPVTPQVTTPGPRPSPLTELQVFCQDVERDVRTAQFGDPFEAELWAGLKPHAETHLQALQATLPSLKVNADQADLFAALMDFRTLVYQGSRREGLAFIEAMVDDTRASRTLRNDSTRNEAHA